MNVQAVLRCRFSCEVRTKGCHYKSNTFCHPVMTAGGGRSNASGALDAGEGMQCICIDEKWGFITPTRVSEHPSPSTPLTWAEVFLVIAIVIVMASISFDAAPDRPP